MNMHHDANHADVGSFGSRTNEIDVGNITGTEVSPSIVANWSPAPAFGAAAKTPQEEMGGRTVQSSPAIFQDARPRTMSTTDTDTAIDVSEALERAAQAIESRSGNITYMQAWKRAAKLVRAMKPPVHSQTDGAHLTGA